MVGKVKIWFLGSGSQCNWLNISQRERGVKPRKNTALLIEFPEANALVDVGNAFPENFFEITHRHPETSFPKALLITHTHPDHITAFDHLPYYLKRAREENPAEFRDPFKIFLSHEAFSDLTRIFYWHSEEELIAAGFSINYIKAGEEFDCLGTMVAPFQTIHGRCQTHGFRFGSFSYIPDFNGLPEESQRIIKGSELIIMECNGVTPSDIHTDLKRAMEWAQFFGKSGTKKFVLTHLGDEFHADNTGCRDFIQDFISENFPREQSNLSVVPSYDLMKLDLEK